jgi:hypothetical protein
MFLDTTHDNYWKQQQRKHKTTRMRYITGQQERRRWRNISRGSINFEQRGSDRARLFAGFSGWLNDEAAIIRESACGILPPPV